MTHERKKPRVLFTPAQREIVKALKKSVCEVYQIEEADLLGDTSTAITSVRFLCFWVLKTNTTMNVHAIGEAFGKCRTAVIYGLHKVEGGLAVYRDMVEGVTVIAEEMNKQPKKFSWHIQAINTLN